MIWMLTRAGIIGRVVAKVQREHMPRPRYRNGVTKWT